MTFTAYWLHGQEDCAEKGAATAADELREVTAQWKRQPVSRGAALSPDVSSPSCRTSQLGLR